MYDTIQEQQEKAFLISVYMYPQTEEVASEHLDELALLSETFGFKVVGKETVRIRKYDPATSIPEGKLEELLELVKQSKATHVVFDDELAPSQQRNLEAFFGRPVGDRTEVILGVFDQRAQTKEARLQVELASVRYQAPRLKRLWRHLSRQSGGGASAGSGATKGEGEKQIELDRRILKDKIDDLKKQLKDVRAKRETQRGLRKKSGIPTLAIIGYTNAGKSTLMNALTEAGVLMEDKLFATLDTTTRKLTLKNNQDILLIDTVGFIRKLPHLLVEAFKSTLEEATKADILVHLIDASHPMALEQAETTFEVLKELGAEKKPMLTLLNKVDKPECEKNLMRLRLSYPHTTPISALTKEGFEDMEEALIDALSKLRHRISLRVPQSDYHIVSEIQKHGQVLSLDYEENDVIIEAEVPGWLAGKLLPKEPDDDF
ncbi:MAG: GTPase HflX [Chlamydiia bacterium]|nr:GTPase HflX [Chlamydiia bacterium]